VAQVVLLARCPSCHPTNSVKEQMGPLTNADHCIKMAWLYVYYFHVCFVFVITRVNSVKHTGPVNVWTSFRFLQATVTGVNPSQPPCVRISAVRAMSEYCSHLSSTDRTHVLQPFIGSMVDGLLTVMMQFSTDVIALCLETLCVVLEVLSAFSCRRFC